jgi:hypothetical protein
LREEVYEPRHRLKSEHFGLCDFEEIALSAVNAESVATEEGSGIRGASGAEEFFLQWTWEMGKRVGLRCNSL